MNTSDFQNLPNVTISGSGRFGGGSYNEVTISGSGHCQSDVVCRELHVSGSGHLGGRLECTDNLRASGNVHIDGDTAAGEVKISGAGHFGASLECGGLRVSGAMHVNKTLRAGEVRVSGAIRASDVEAESFHLSGVADISGLLNAETVEIEFYGAKSSPVRIASIGCTTLKAHRSSRCDGGWGLGRLFRSDDKSKPMMEAKTIEGDDIELEYTDAEVVRGSRVTIGEGCRIGRVEYTESLNACESCTIGESVKLD